MDPRWAPLLDRLDGAWRFRWKVLALTAVVTLGGWVIVFGLPDRYEADAKVLVDTRTALKPALQGLTNEQDVGVQLDFVRQSLLADPELLRIAQSAGILPSTGPNDARREKLLDQLRQRIDLSVETADGTSGDAANGTTYGIEYQDTNRAHALALVRILLDALVNETLGGKTQGSEHAQQFLLAQIGDYEQRLRAAEDRLAAFKSKHLGLMPTEQGGYFAQLQRETESIEDVKTKLLTAESRRGTLEKQLHGDAAVTAAAMMPIEGQRGLEPGVDTVTQIAAMQEHLDQLLLQFTDKHPDVIAARQALAELKRRRAQEIASLKRGDANAAVTSGASSNPVYQSIELALNQVDVDISDLHTELAAHEEKAKELKTFLDTAPQIEAEYAQLSRDYDVNKAQYAALLENYEKARLGEQADKAGSVKFEVVQPPTVSFVPVWPKRTKLLTEVFLLGLAAGGALAWGLDQLSPVVASASGLANLTGMTVLGVVGAAFDAGSSRTHRHQISWVSIAAGVLAAAFLLAVTLSRSGVRLSVSGLLSLVHA